MRRILAAAAWPALLSAGCAATAAGGGRDADASINGIRTELRDIRSAFVQMEQKLSAGRDVNQNDKWTLRLLGGGLLLLGLSYPVGKLTWLMTGTLRRKAGQLSEVLRIGALPQDAADALVPMKHASESPNLR
jgi:outer membrane murein-binding lipoprotein Lpp